MKLWFVKTMSGLAPADDDARAALKRFPIGTSIEVDVTTRKLRSLQFHRRYWLLMGKIAENIDTITIEPGMTLPVRCAEDVHVAVKYATGLYDSYAIKGGVVRLLKSTAFDKMDADAWAAYYPRVLDAVHRVILPGVDIAEVEQELARLAS